MTGQPQLIKSNQVRLSVRPDFFILSAPDWMDREFHSLLQIPAAQMVALPGAEVLPTVPSTTVVTLWFQGQRLYFKYFMPARGLARLKNLFRDSKAMLALRGAYLLSGCGIRTPEIIAVRQDRGLAQGNEALLVTRHTEGRNLRIYIRNEELDRKNRALLATSLGREVARMHSSGLTHGDLHIGNVLVRLNQDVMTFAFIDTERVKKNASGFNRHVLKDLSLLNHPNLGCLTARDRLRFFVAYMNERRAAGLHARFRTSDIMSRVHHLSKHRYGRKSQKKTEQKHT